MLLTGDFWGCWLGWTEVTLGLHFLVMVCVTALGDTFKVFAIFQTGWPSIPTVMMDCHFHLLGWLDDSCHDIDSKSCQIELSSVYQPDFCAAQLMVPAPLRKGKKIWKLTLTRYQWSGKHCRWLPHWEKVKGLQSRYQSSLNVFSTYLQCIKWILHDFSLKLIVFMWKSYIIISYIHKFNNHLWKDEWHTRR